MNIFIPSAIQFYRFEGEIIVDQSYKNTFIFRRLINEGFQPQRPDFIIEISVFRLCRCAAAQFQMANDSSSKSPRLSARRVIPVLGRIGFSAVYIWVTIFECFSLMKVVYFCTIWMKIGIPLEKYRQIVVYFVSFRLIASGRS